MENNNTKIIIFTLGIAIIAFFGYLIYIDSRKTSQTALTSELNMLNQQTEDIQLITKRISNLENKISSMSQRKVVNMSPTIKPIRKYEEFGMR